MINIERTNMVDYNMHCMAPGINKKHLLEKQRNKNLHLNSKKGKKILIVASYIYRSNQQH